MSDDRVRYGRQIRLPEIGEAGQERLCAAEVTPRSAEGDAREIEVAYLRAAGVKVRDGGGDGSASSSTSTSTIDVREPAARDLAEGALAALVAMRAILGVGEDPHAGSAEVR